MIKKILFSILTTLGISNNTSNASEINLNQSQIKIEKQQLNQTFQEIECKVGKICIFTEKNNYELGHFSDIYNLRSAEPKLVSEINSLKKNNSFDFEINKIDLIIAGTSYHNFYLINKDGEKYSFNTNNEVLGGRYNLNNEFSIEGGIYKDSFRADSEWLSANWMPIKFNLKGEELYLKLGIATTLTNKQMIVDGGKQWIVFPMPKFQIGIKSLKIDIGIIPFRKDHSKQRKASNSIVTMQISIPLNF